MKSNQRLKTDSVRHKNGVELADVVRRFRDEYISRFGACMMPSQKKALADIAACGTRKLGGRLHHCNDCGRDFWIYHGCRNRACPKCSARRTRDWLERREAELLPCEYFHVVVTVPEELRHAFLSEQKYMYGLLMKTSADALREMAMDAKHLGAMPGILAVLHTWTAQLRYHPHVHMLVTGGGVTEDGRSWREPRGEFLVPVRAFSKIVRARLRDTLQAERPELFESVPPKAWRREWCSFCKHYGTGRQAVLKYLSRYVHRIAICNSRIIAVDETHVTFRYKDHAARRWRITRLTGVEFLRRFLMHVLPRGFHKVRYYGLSHPSRSGLAFSAWLLLMLNQRTDDTDNRRAAMVVAEPLTDAEWWTADEPETDSDRPACPECGGRRTRVILEAPRPRVP